MSRSKRERERERGDNKYENLSILEPGISDIKLEVRRKKMEMVFPRWTSFYSIMLPSIFEKHKMCLN